MRPGSRTKVSVPLVLPQNRHPERSASPMDCVTQRLWRGVEGPRRCLFYPCCSELFDHRSPTTICCDTHLMVMGTLFHAQVCAWSLNWGSIVRMTLSFFAGAGFGGRKAPNSMGKISTAEVLRLRATSAASRNPSVRRSAQDDASVGELTERKPLCGSRGALQIPRLRSG